MPTQINDYAHPELLCDTAWLAAHLNDPALRLIDCGMPDAYNRAHLPGAVGLPHPYLKGDKSPFVMAPQQFEGLMAERGIANDSPVILYDDNASLYAARVWWVFDHFGYRNVKVLNGGFNRWLHEARPLTSQAPRPARSQFRATVSDTHLCTLDGLSGGVGDPATVVWDVRSQEEWMGENNRGNQRRGHVPGAVHLEWRELMEGPPERRFKPAAELRRMLAERGITPDKRVITY
ncbi:MAG: sulfurtransferase [Dehalococcoidia bacterium]|nr:sulfurtransferase [Dehalococcoidia bacterium]